MSYNKTKTDPELGQAVHQHLVKMGVETPTFQHVLDRKDKIELIEKDFKHIMEVLGLDLTDDSLMDTPKRVAKMYVNEIFWGLDYEAFPKCTTVDNKMKYDEMVIERNVNVQSNCEHHFVPIVGKTHIAYISSGKVIGLSKLNRVVQYFAKRPQVQERLTIQIGKHLQKVLASEDVAVFIDAKHLCVSSRGVKDDSTSTITSFYGGKFQEENTKAEFLKYLDINA